MSNTQSIVIGKKNVGEQDIQIILLTQSVGKIYAKARGASKITSSRLGSLQLGNIIDCALNHTSPYFVSQTKTIFSFMQTQKTLSQTNLLFLLLELVNKITPQEEPNQDLFFETKQAIFSIDKSQVGLFLKHEIKIINILGYGTPQIILEFLEKSDFRNAQQSLQHYVESIIDKPLQSKKLFS